MYLENFTVMSNQSENQTSAKLKQNLDIEATVLTVKSSADNILRHFIPNPSRAISKSLPILLNCFLEKVPTFVGIYVVKSQLLS